MSKIVIGVDPSLNGTGLARWAKGKWTTATIKFKAGGPIHPKLHRIEDRLSEFLFAEGAPALAVIEGPSYGSTSSSQHQLGGTWWHMAHILYEQGIPYAIATPNQRAKYAAGRGGAGKPEVHDAINGPLFPGARTLTYDESDALSLAAMGLRWLGIPQDKVPEINQEPLSAMTWPDIERF